MKKKLFFIGAMLFSVLFLILCVHADDIENSTLEDMNSSTENESSSVEPADGNTLTMNVEDLTAILEKIGFVQNDEQAELVVQYLKLAGMAEEEARALLNQIRVSLDEQYGSIPWYQKVSEWFDHYIGYIVAIALLLGLSILALVIKKTGVNWIKDKLEWVQNSFLPWVKDKSKDLDDMKVQYHQMLDTCTLLQDDYRKMLEACERWDSQKQMLEQQLILAEQARTNEVECVGKRYGALTQALSLMATELSFVADTFGLNNKQAELVKKKYATVMELIAAELNDTEKVMVGNDKQS